MTLHDPGLPGDDTPVGVIRPIPTGSPRPDRPTRLGRRPDRRTRRRSRRRRVLRVALGVIVVVLGYYAITLFQVWTTGRSNQVRPVDAIVVMGAAQYDGTPSPQLAARLDHVVAIWPANVAPLIIVTGGSQPGDRFTEAAASAAYLIERGIPDSSILRETVGRDTNESMIGVAGMLNRRGLDSVLIVTDPYHSLRSRLIAESLGLDAYVSPTDTSVVTGGSNIVRHLQEAAGVAVGRIVGFDQL